MANEELQPPLPDQMVVNDGSAERGPRFQTRASVHIGRLDCPGEFLFRTQACARLQSARPGSRSVVRSTWLNLADLGPCIAPASLLVWSAPRLSSFLPFPSWDVDVTERTSASALLLERPRSLLSLILALGHFHSLPVVQQKRKEIEETQPPLPHPTRKRRVSQNKNKRPPKPNKAACPSYPNDRLSKCGSHLRIRPHHHLGPRRANQPARPIQLEIARQSVRSPRPCDLRLLFCLSSDSATSTARKPESFSWLSVAHDMTP